MKRFWASTLAAVGLLIGSATTAVASDTWCDIDPAVVITTPAGNTVIVYVVNSGPLTHAAELIGATYAYTAQRDGSGKTLVDLHVLIADTDGHRHAVRTEVWTGAARTGTLLSSRSGTASIAIPHQFTLNVP